MGSSALKAAVIFALHVNKHAKKWGLSVLGSFSLALVLQRLKLNHLLITFSQPVQEFKLSF